MTLPMIDGRGGNLPNQIFGDSTRKLSEKIDQYNIHNDANLSVFDIPFDKIVEISNTPGLNVLKEFDRDK